MHNEGIGYDRLQIRCADNIEKTVYFAYHLRKEKIMSESAIQKLRQGKMVAFSSLETICRLLYLQPGDVIGILWGENDAFIPNEPIKGSH